MELNELSFKIRGAIFAVFTNLGPGLLESVYEKALALELKNAGLMVASQSRFNAAYLEENLGLGFRMDLLVEERVAIEVKSVKELTEVHFKQLHTYLKLADLRLGILVNFNVGRLVDKKSLIRIINEI